MLQRCIAAWMPFLFQFFTENHVYGFLPRNRLVEFLARHATHDMWWLFMGFSKESLSGVWEPLDVVGCCGIFGLSCNSCVSDGCLWIHRLIGMPLLWLLMSELMHDYYEGWLGGIRENIENMMWISRWYLLWFYVHLSVIKYVCMLELACRWFCAVWMNGL